MQEDMSEKQKVMASRQSGRNHIAVVENVLMGGDINRIGNKMKIKMAGVLYPTRLEAGSKIQPLN